MVVTFHRLTRSLPLDIDAKVSFYNLSPAPTVIPSPAAVATTATPAAPDPTTSALFGGASSARTSVQCYRRTNNFDKVVDFLGTMAEAESFKGKQTYSLTSSASGIFHFLTGTEAGTTKQA
jgi:hypothetical protein